MYYAHTREDGKHQTLIEHLQETSKLAGEFAAAFGAAEWGEIIGLYHDVGKATTGFEKRLFHDGPKVDHSTAGAQAVQKLCGFAGAYCIAGHHGGLPDGGKPADTSADSTLQSRLRKVLSGSIACNPFEVVEAPNPVQSMPIKDIGLGGFSFAMFVRMLASCLIDADRLDTERYTQYGEVNRGGHEDVSTLHARLMAVLEGFSAASNPINEKRNEIQTACLRVASEEPGLFSLTVPTGGGKTLSSLAFALKHAQEHGLKRIVYVIPYVSIIEQNADVFRKNLGRENVVEHHSNYSFDDSDEHALRQRLATENWDCELIVTTNVQFFSSLFASKTSQLRKLHNIAQSVIIFDEAQMIPLPYLKPCVSAIAELTANYGCTAVLMSATQPALAPFFPKGMQIREIVDDPEGLYTFFRRTTLRHLGDITEAELADRLAEHEQVLCIVGTRKLAQRLYNKLRGEGTYHLSTLMYPNHRREVLDEIRKRIKAGLPCRIISTSMIEAGVDIDLPVVYRQEAGLDSILQAAGRCNREGKRDCEASFVYVFKLVGDDVPGIPVTMRQNIHAAQLVFRECDDPASLDAIHLYFESLYKLKDEELDAKRILPISDGGVSIPFRKIERDFQMIESNTLTLIVPANKTAMEIVDKLRAGEHGREMFRTLGAYSVNVYREHLAALYQAGAVEQLGEDSWVLTLWDTYYDMDMGVKLDVETGLGFHI